MKLFIWVMMFFFLILSNVEGENEELHHEGIFSFVNNESQLFSGVVSNKHVRSLVECCQLCFKETACIFFNYKSGSIPNSGINCQLLAYTMATPPVTENEEWELYRMMDPCATKKPCNNGGTCIDELSLPLGFQCKCNIPFTGEFCETEIGPESTCTALKKKHSSLQSGFYNVSSNGVDLSLIRVYCDMTSRGRVGVTVVGHDSETRMKVDGYEVPGSYSRKIQYDLTMEQVNEIINASKQCEQFISYQCHGSVIFSNNKFYAWWVSRQGAQMNYWGGAAVDSGKCACGITNTCAGGRSCNCDMNDQVPREDSGFLSDSNTLPVTELRFGDTGLDSEYGYHTLGKLLCWG